MLKLIAIKPLDGCCASVCKCLSIGKMYYFCNDYYITEDGIELRDEYVKLLPKDFFSFGTKCTLQINISAIVGMNGDGKSTLIELVMRLINNCAKHYRLTDRDNLLRIEGVKAELYYQIDEIVYCIRETKKDRYTRVLKYADMSNSSARQWNKLMIPVKGVSRRNELFYTIVSNYSLYAYNTKDFRAEWNNQVQSKEESMKCWLYYLFHKNDGYRTPITIHPYRYEGNIDVNRETELTMQRLMALYIQEPNPNEDKGSFRRIGNKDAEFLKLTDVGYSKLQEVSVCQYFKDNKSISSLSKYINQIEDIVRNYDDIKAENLHDNTLEIIEKRLDLLVGVVDASYRRFLDEFCGWLGHRYGIYSSKSDLRQLLNALKKFNNQTDSNPIFARFIKKYKKYDKLNIQQLKRLRLIYDVMQCWGFPAEIFTKEYGRLNEVERCQHYIIYKTISICAIYPEYRDFIDNNDAGWNNIGLIFKDSVIDEIVKQIKADQTHVTLKLRQCLNFIDQLKGSGNNVFESLSKTKSRQELRPEFEDSLVISFDDLRLHYKQDIFPLDSLPPPIYKAEILFYSEQSRGVYIPYNYLSSGEKQLLNNFGALIYHLRNIDSVVDNRRLYENVNVILEEIELYFHPEYQRMIVKMLLEKLQSIVFKHIKRVNITFVTHSPFILSDIPLCNVLFLKNGNPAMEKMQENTFGANIHGLLKNGFFLPSLPMGEFAYYKINELFDKLNGYKLNPNDSDQKDWFYSNIMRVGEPYLREQLMKLYNMHYSACER